MKNQNTNSQSGFTLVELLLVVFVVVILVGLSLSSFLQSQTFQIYNNNFGKLFSIVNNARSQAITGKGQMDHTDYDRDGVTTADYVTPANYGVRFDTGAAPNVRLFADLNPPLTGGLGAAGRFDTIGSYAQGKDVVLDSLSLPSGIKLVVVDGAGVSQASSSIFFSPNYADISYENLDVSANPFVKIQLTETQTGLCKQIIIHKLAGIPEVELCN